jgi:CheY-like chemotaxis protein
LARKAVPSSTGKYEEQPSMVVGGEVKHASVVPTARILVIEDNPSDVFLLERALQKQDLRFELIHLEDGGEALAFIRRKGAYEGAAIPDLILLDLNLPKSTGDEIAREIPKAEHLVSIPVCVWSSARFGQDQSLLRSLGVVRCITKPSGLDQFMEIGIIIKNLLGRSPSRLTAMT